MNYEEQLGSLLRSVEIPADLGDQTAKAVFLKRREQARLKLGFLSGVVLGTAVALIPLSRSLYTGVIESGFSQYLSLILSDHTALLADWRELAWSLLETAPLFGLSAFLATCLVLVWTGSQAVSQSRLIGITISKQKTI